MRYLIWKILILSIIVILFQTKLIACNGEEKQGVEIDYICSCLDDCDREHKCTWVFESLNSLISDDETVKLAPELQVLQKQQLYLLEIVDYGWAGCFSTYGSYKDKYFRIDMEIQSDKPYQISEYKVDEVNKIPSLKQRKLEIDTDTDDDTCLFRLP